MIPIQLTSFRPRGAPETGAEAMTEPASPLKLAAAPRRDPQALLEHLSRRMLRAVGEHRLLEEGDRILAAISGGKDSYTMLELLLAAQRKSPVRYEVIAVHLDQGQPGYEGRPLEEWLRSREIRHDILREDTYSIVLEKAADNSTYCGPCSRLRRGILYTAAERLGCNKVALGHHRDDALETLLLNLFYAGRLQAMPARYHTNDGRFVVIRPLIECAEEDIAEHARNAGYPILPCRLCGSQDNLKRDAVASLLARLEVEIPGVRSVMLSALKNVRLTHLLDREAAEAWEAQAHRYPPRR